MAAATCCAGPAITSQPENLQVVAGQPATFSVTAGGTGLSYQWQRNGADIPGATGPLFSLAHASRTDAGYYTVTVTGGGTAATSQAAVLAVAPAQFPGLVATDPAWSLQIENNGSALSAVVVDANGGYYLGGAFTNVNGIGQTGIVHVLADGSVDRNFIPPQLDDDTGILLALQNDGRLLVGGNFKRINGVVMPWLIRLNPDGSLDHAFQPGLAGSVAGIALQPDGKVLICGWFWNVLGTNRSHVARLNADGSLDSSFDPGQGTGGYVGTIALQPDGKVVIGGSFTSFNGVTSPGIARLAASGAVDTSFSPGGGMNGTVQAVGVDGTGRILAGGSFTQFAGSPAGRIVRLTASGAVDASFAPGSGFSAPVNRIAFDGSGNVLVACDYATFNGGAVSSDVFRVTGSGAADTGFTLQATDNWSSASSLAAQEDGHVLVVGNFNNYGGAARWGFARLASSGAVDSTTFKFRYSAYGTSAVAMIPGGKVMVGGYITYVRGAPVPANLVRFNADGSLDTSFNPGGRGANGQVLAIAVLPNGETLIGGSFGQYNTTNVSAVALLRPDGTPDPAFATPSGGIGGTVRLLGELPGGQVVIAGSFSSVGGAATGNVAVLNADGSRASGFRAGSGTNGTVIALAVQPDGKMVLAGQFTAYNGVAVGNIVRVLPSGAIDPTFNAGTGADAGIFCVGLEGNGQIVLGGSFTHYNGASVPAGLIRLNSDGTIDGSFAALKSPGYIDALLVQEDGSVLVRGSFWEIDNLPGTIAIARFSATGAWDTNFLAAGVGDSSGPPGAPLLMRDDGQLFTADLDRGFVGTKAGAAPTITASPVAQSVSAGQSATLSVTAASPAAVIYQWLLDGKPIPGATGSSFTLANFNGADVGNYSAAVRSELGTTVSAAAAVSAAPVAGPPSNSRLINISTLGQVGIAANALDSGFSITGGSKTVLIRAVGPGLAPFGVQGLLAQPLLTIYDSAQKPVASNSGWSSSDAATMAAVGAFPLVPGSADAALVATLPPGSYTGLVSGLGSANTGNAIVEIYDVSGSGQLVNISSRLVVGGASGTTATAGFVIGEGDGARKLLIRGIGPGLANYGIAGVLTDPKISVFDANSQDVADAVANGGVQPLVSATNQSGAFTASAGDAANIVTFNPGLYSVQLSSNSGSGSGVGLIEIYDITNTTGTPAALAAATPTLYFASLQPASGASGSTASGYATILFDPNTNVATINLSISNLSSPLSAAHLVVGSSAASGNNLVAFPGGQASHLTWTFRATGSYSTSDLIAALQSGHIFVDADTVAHPAGELQGGFLRTSGSSTFFPPAAPPALPAIALTAPTQTDAARFLTQASFGPTTADISRVVSEGISKWIADQLAMPFTSHLAGLRADVAAFPNPPVPASMPGVTFFYTTEVNRVAAWWKIALTAPDQLRQRVAFALSQIFVVSAANSDLSVEQESLARYYDLLGRDAFGNFRQLLDDVTLDPAMGLWLTYVHNRKADPFAGTSPDENYARELQQLFTIGLVQLQPDGTLLLDSAGQPIPTYNQTMVSETAKVFTGWSYANVQNFTDNPPFVTTTQVPDSNGWLNPMGYFDIYHDKTPKNVVSLQQVPLAQASPTVIPANQTGPQDLKMMLDALFNHPNTGPFFCRQLIQRLVTSNPSPGYVYRVAQVFANNGAGIRGDLGAVVTAVLTDYEARSPDVLGNAGYGKLKEPLLRASAFFRILKAAAPNGRYLDSYFGDTRGNGYYPSTSFASPQNGLGQEPLDAPTVFNFYSPQYTVPGPVASAGLVAPEMEITDASHAISVPNWLSNNFLYRPAPPVLSPPAPSPSPYLALDFSELLAAQASSAGALVDTLNLLFCANQMSAATRAQILGYLTGPAASQSPLTQVQNALQLALVAPDSAFQD